MNTPNGLRRYNRVITTKRSEACSFCGRPTVAHADYAAVDAAGKWHPVCQSCSATVSAQVRGLVNRLATATTGMTPDQLAPFVDMIPASATLQAGMADDAPDAVAYDVLVSLQRVLAAFTAATKPAPDNALLAGLQAIANLPTAQPRDREFAASLAEQLERKGVLSDKQVFCAQRLIDQVNTPPAPTVPAGRYAIALPGDVLKFYVVDCPESGKWAGYTFVSVLASDEEHRIRDPKSRKAILDAIATDVPAAALAYATHMGHCGFCRRSLTRQYSREVTGYGPVCADKHGLPFDHAAYAASAKLSEDDGE